MSAGKFMLLYLQGGANNLYPEIITWELQKADDQEGFISVLGIKKKTMLGILPFNRANRISMKVS